MSKETSTLPTRALGTTGMAITRVGFGAWAIGGGGWAFAWGSQDDDAVDRGDAARRRARRELDRHRRGVRARTLGRTRRPAASRLRARAIGRTSSPSAASCGTSEDRLAQALRIGEPASLRREVEQSLTRLGVEQIDLYQMHWPAEDGTPVEVYWQTLLDLKKEGKVRAVGLSNHKVDRLEAAERLGHVDTLQPPFSADPPRRARPPSCRGAARTTPA